MEERFPLRHIVLLLLSVAILLPPAGAQSKARSKSPAVQKPAAPDPAPLSRTVPLPPDLEVKRLIMKDGSYQPVMKVQVAGDRVRYLSAERYEWEEIPYSLIDWPATGDYARQGAHPKVSAEAAAVDAEEQAERKKEEEASPTVAPGLRLPATGGVFLLDVYNRQAQLNALEQNGGEIKRNTTSNILRATINPLASQKQTVELKGQHARAQAHVANPYLYLNVDPEEGSSNPTRTKDGQERYRIVRAESIPKKDVRVVGNIKVAIYGRVSQEQKSVPASIEVFSGKWIKVTPAEPLEPGEYALVEMLEDNQMNLFVWDFGVNPNAPENPGAWRPQPEKANPATAAGEPVLNQRK